MSLLLFAPLSPALAQNQTLGDFRPAWSPDGRSIAFQSTRDGNDEIYHLDVATGYAQRLTHHLGSDAQPSWSPDGAQIVFASTRDRDQYSGLARYQLYAMNADGSDVHRLVESTSADFLPRWSPDGGSIVFLSDRSGALRLYVMPSSGGEARPVLPASFGATPGNPAWSPDGRRIAFDAEVDSQYDLFAIDLASSEVVNLTRSPEDEWYPAWSPDGSRLITGVFAGEGDTTTHQLASIDPGTRARYSITRLKPRSERAWDFWPTWSPDGHRIAFASMRHGAWRLLVTRADGTQERALAVDPVAAIEAHGDEFDFMLGKWIVLDTNGERRAHATWKRLPGEIAAFEEEKDFGTWWAHKFVSFGRREVEPQWVMTSIDGPFETAPPGHHLIFRGGLRDGRMVLDQDGEYYEGKRAPENLARCRQIFDPQEDGTVLHTFEVTYDDGRTWKETHRSSYVPFFEP